MRHRSSAKHKQDKRLQLFVTQKEYEALMAEYKISDLHSVSAYLRKKVVGNGIIIPYASELKSTLDTIGYQYERIGNNINQIAKKVHLFSKEGCFPVGVVNSIHDVMEQYLKVTEDLTRAHRVFLRELGRK